MKLKEFNTENTAVVKTSTPSIGINTKSGLFGINRAACDLLALKENDQVCFHQDEEAPEDWYIEKAKAKGFILREKANVTSGVFFNNTPLARKIFEAVGYNTEASGKLLIAGKETVVDKRKFHGLLKVPQKD